MKNKTIKRISIFGIMLLLMIIFSNSADATVYYASNNLSTFTVKNANWVVYSDYIEWTTGGDDQLSLTEDMTGNNTFYVRFEAKVNTAAELSKAVYDGVIAVSNVGENGYWNGDCFYYDGSSWNDYCNNDGKFHNYTYRYDETNSDFDAYKDGVNICANCSYDTRSTSYVAADLFYFRSKGTKPGQLRIQDFCISSTKDENCFEEPPTPPAPSNGTLYVPRSTNANQTGVVSVTSTSYVPIITGTVEVLNRTNISLTGTGYVVGFGSNSIANCEINFDSVQVGVTSTSPPNSKSNSFFINSEIVEKTKGNYTLQLNCKKDGTNTFEVYNSDIIITQYVNNEGNPLNTKHEKINAAITSSNYQSLGAFKFNTTNTTIPTGAERYLVFESSTTNHYDSTGTTCIVGTAFGLNSSEYCRYGTAGKTGSGSAFNMIQNISDSTEVNIQILGKSTTSDGSANISITIYEVVAHTNEMNQSDLKNVNITNSAFTVLKTAKFSNIDHTSIDSMIKASFSVKSNTGSADMGFRLALSGDALRNGSIIQRDVLAADQEGIVSLQKVFSNLPVGNYTLELQGFSSNSDATISDGQITIVTVNEVVFEPNTFQVRAFNDWNGSQLNDFNVTTSEGTTFLSGPGNIATVTVSKLLDNLTISKAGYLPRTYVNHNTSFDLNTSIYQSRVQFRLYEVYTGNLVTNFTVQGPTASYNTTNGTYNLKTNLGLVPINITVPNYYNLSGISLNVTSSVQNINLFEAYQSKLRINLTDIITGLPINNFTANISNSTYSYTAQITTTNGTANFEGLMPGNFTLNIDAINYALTNYNFSVVKGLNNLVFQIFTTNSVNFTIYDAETNELITGRTVNIELIGDFVSYNYSTTTGTYYADLISPASYKIRTIADGYEQTINTFTLENRTYNQVSVYMLNSSSSTDVSIQIVNKLDNSPLEGYFVKVLQYSDETGSYLNTQTLETDFDGKAVANIRLGEEFYRFFVLNRELTLVESTNASYIYQTNIIIPVSVGEDVLLDYENEQGVTYSLVYNDATDSFRYEFDDSMGTASQGCIKVYRVYSNEQTLINTTCQTGSSGIILNPITPVNGSTFVAKAYVYFGNEEIYLTTQSKSFKLMDMDDSAWLFYDFLLTAAISIAFVWSPTIMVTLIPLPSLMLSILGLVPFDWGIMIVIQIIFLALGSYLGKRG